MEKVWFLEFVSMICSCLVEKQDTTSNEERECEIFLDRLCPKYPKKHNPDEQMEESQRQFHYKS